MNPRIALNQTVLVVGGFSTPPYKPFEIEEEPDIRWLEEPSPEPAQEPLPIEEPELVPA